MNIYLELFGYLGTVLVLASMMMTSMSRLRVVNIAGSAIGMIYAIAMATWPVALLNLGLILINSVQLGRQVRRNKEVTA